jgi:hypothetical protein
VAGEPAETDKIVASNLAAAIVQARGSEEADPGWAAQLYFECFDALAAEAKKRPKNTPLPSFGSY